MTLTKRESEVARLIALDLTFDQIAEELEISRLTVATHVKNAARKIPGDGRPRHKLKMVVFWTATPTHT